MIIDQPSRMATALLSPLLTAALVLGIVSEHSFAAEGSDSDRGFANSPAVTLGLEKSGIDPSEIATYSQFAESLLADATARVTAYGDGNVPAYAEYLKDAFIEGGFDPKDIQILPLDETVSLVVRIRETARAIGSPWCSHRTWTLCPPRQVNGCGTRCQCDLSLIHI